jgi:hypothetical protein
MEEYKEGEGKIKDILNMPLGTAIIVMLMVTLILIVLMSFALYSWVSDYFLDARYRVNLSSNAHVNVNEKCRKQ